MPTLLAVDIGLRTGLRDGRPAEYPLRHVLFRNQRVHFRHCTYLFQITAPMSTHYIIRESQFSLFDTTFRRKIGINPKGVRVDVTLTEGGPVQVGFMEGTGISWQCEIHEPHRVHSFDTTGNPPRHLVVSAITPSLARGTVLVWGLVDIPEQHDV
jgi:hypothetical protein